MKEILRAPHRHLTARDDESHDAGGRGESGKHRVAMVNDSEAIGMVGEVKV
jgi:hypothetical protein